jgi:hypothetical protein
MSIDVNVQNDLVIVTESSEDITVNVSNAAGPAGVGVPVGGTTGQVLKKQSGTDYDTFWAADNAGVPYSGATGDVNLGANKLTILKEQFTPTTLPTYSEGLVWYDSDQESLAFYNDSSLSPVYIGENIVLKVYNNTGATIAKGAAVYIQSGGAFVYPNVALARADSPSTAAVIGLMNAATPTGSFGYVTSTGVITGVNTGAYSEGTILYLSPYAAGMLMNTVPPTGYVIQVGVVAHSNTPNGTIYTKQTTPLAISAATITGQLAVSQGGTGSSTASGALTNLGAVPTTRTLTINGTTQDLSADRTFTIAAGISGSGATGQVAYWNGTSSQTGSNNLFWDAANSRLGIGTNAPTEVINIKSATDATTSRLLFNQSTNTQFYSYLQYTGSGNLVQLGGAFSGTVYNILTLNLSTRLTTISNDLTISGNNINLGSGTISWINSVGLAFSPFGATNAMRILQSTGNILMGTTTDGGQRLQVQGDAFIKGSGATSATNALLVQNSAGTQQYIFNNAGQAMFGINVPSGGTVKLETDGVFRAWTQIEVGQFGNVAINTTSLSKTATGSDFFQFTNAASHTATSGTYYFLQLRNTVAPTSGTGVFNNLNLNITINQTGGANGITRGLYINPTLTAAADWRAIEVSAGGAYINTTSVQASAILQADSTTKGFLPPRMTNAQRTAISSPAVGLIVYCTDMVEGLYVYKSTGWTFVI